MGTLQYHYLCFVDNEMFIEVEQVLEFILRCMWGGVYGHMCVTAHVQVEGQLVEVAVLLPHGFWGSN